MILSDRTIRKKLLNGEIKVNPLPIDECIQPNSIDLTLDDIFLTSNDVEIKTNQYMIKPHEFLLGQTVERIELPADICAKVDGKSSFGRKGLLVHVTAGFIDSGFKGNITLEMYNLSQRPILLNAYDKIAQIIFEVVDKDVERLYGDKELGSHYQGQNKPMR